MPEGYLIERSNNQWRVTREEDNAILGHFETVEDAEDAADGDGGVDEDTTYENNMAPVEPTEPATPVQVDEFSAQDEDEEDEDGDDAS